MSLKPDSPLAQDFIASPNYGERRNFSRPDCIILHYTGMPTAAGALAWLTNPASEVSAHYFIHEDGRVLQLVAESRRAWHAGKSFWKGVTDLNSASIGIEIVNAGHEQLPPFPQRQIDAVIALCLDIAERHKIAPERILAHSDIAPGRKRDPGEKFPWEALRRAGVGHWPRLLDATADDAPLGREASRVTALQALLALYGYGVEPSGVYEQKTRDVVAAFQRHFRCAKVDGEMDGQCLAILKSLLAGAAEPASLSAKRSNPD